MQSNRLQDFIPNLSDFPDIHFGDTVDLIEPSGSPIPFQATVLPGGPQGGRVFLRFEAPYSPELHARLQANADRHTGGLAFQVSWPRLGGFTEMRSPAVALTIIQRESGASVQSEDGQRLEFVVSVFP